MQAKKPMKKETPKKAVEDTKKKSKKDCMQSNSQGGMPWRHKRILIMAKLTAAKRKALPKKEFALPGIEKYPVNDKSHAANAKARASEMVKKGKLSVSSKNMIDAKANKVLGKKKK